MQLSTTISHTLAFYYLAFHTSLPYLLLDIPVTILSFTLTLLIAILTHLLVLLSSLKAILALLGVCWAQGGVLALGVFHVLGHGVGLTVAVSLMWVMGMGWWIAVQEMWCWVVRKVGHWVGWVREGGWKLPRGFLGGEEWEGETLVPSEKYGVEELKWSGGRYWRKFD